MTAVPTFRTTTPNTHWRRCSTHGWSSGESADEHDVNRQMLAHIDAAATPCQISDGATIHAQRTCNGCGENIGDVTRVETECAVQDVPLPDVREECPRCWPSVDGAAEYEPVIRGVIERHGRDTPCKFVLTRQPLTYVAVGLDGSLLLTYPDATLRIPEGNERARYRVLFDLDNIPEEFL